MADNGHEIYSGFVVKGVDDPAYYATKLLSTLRWGRQCAIAIANDTPYALFNPQRFENTGKVINMPMRIPSGHTGLIGAQKGLLALYGCSGVLTFEFDNLGILSQQNPSHLQLMWSVPYTGKNYVSIVLGEETASKELFDNLFERDEENLFPASATAFTKFTAENQFRIDGYMTEENSAILVLLIQETT